MNDGLQSAEQSFVEDVGLYFERSGLPRMAGRLLGWLMIADPPHQSTDELAAALMASKGSISTTTRFLIQIGLAERLSLPGVRHDYFRIRPGTWHHLTKQRQEDMALGRKLAERALELTKGRASPGRQLLVEMRDAYAFMEKELPALIERWEQEQSKDRVKRISREGQL